MWSFEPFGPDDEIEDCWVAGCTRDATGWVETHPATRIDPAEWEPRCAEHGGREFDEVEPDEDVPEDWDHDDPYYFEEVELEESYD